MDRFTEDISSLSGLYNSPNSATAGADLRARGLVVNNTVLVGGSSR